MIAAISIEGHSSSEWDATASQDEAYFNNMALSQARSRAVLEYCLRLPSISPDKDWLISVLTANGLSSSRNLIRNGIELSARSRRVEFRVITQNLKIPPLSGSAQNADPPSILLGTHDQDRTLGVTDDFIRNTTHQHPFKSSTSMTADDN